MKKKNKSYFKVNETENGYTIELDKIYLESLLEAIKRAFKYGYYSDSNEYLDAIDMEEEISKKLRKN